MNSLEQYLGGLEIEGLKESEGGFTIALDKAKDKLSRYRQQSAHHYILSVLSAAVSAESSFLATTLSTGTHRVAFGGKPYALSELQSLANSLAAGGNGAEPRLKELGLAIQGARMFDLRRFELISGEKQAAVKLSLSGNTLTLQPLESLPQWMTDSKNSTLLHLSTGRSSITDELSSIFLGVKRVPEVAKLLRRYGRFAPLSLLLDGENIAVQRLGPWAVAGEVTGSPHTPRLHLESKRRQDLAGDEELGGYLGFDQGPGGWMLVNNGLCFQYPADISMYPTSRAVLYTRHLERDLSGAGLVRNADFENVIQKAQRYLDRLAGKVAGTVLTSGLKEIMADPISIARSRTTADQSSV